MFLCYIVGSTPLMEAFVPESSNVEQKSDNVEQRLDSADHKSDAAPKSEEEEG